MKNHSLLFTLLFVTIGTLSFTYISEDYTLSKDYSIQFSTKKAAGNLSGLKGEVSVSKDNISNALINVTVDVSTIETGNKTKDKHAKGESWFDATQFPTISFKASSVEIVDGKYIANGNLTIKDVTKQISIPLTSSKKLGKPIWKAHLW